MSDTRINDLMLQMQVLAAKAGAGPSSGTEGGTGSGTDTDFGALLKQSIDAVNATQQTAGDMTARFETGDPSVELGEVMVALQKADLSFKAMTEVRNKLVDAYQEIMNMPV
jgi:flagellar hook-basal body complex protein FliE